MTRTYNPATRLSCLSRACLAARIGCFTLCFALAMRPRVAAIKPHAHLQLSGLSENICWMHVVRSAMLPCCEEWLGRQLSCIVTVQCTIEIVTTAQSSAQKLQWCG